MITIKATCPSCNKDQIELSVENLDGSILGKCPVCGAPYYVNLQLKVGSLNPGDVALMALREILNATTVIGGYLLETKGEKPTGSWKRTSTAVDKLKVFAENIRPLCKKD
jgi:hypothetical protein